ncbi:MAG: Beta-barrel assembly-enhancing protease [Turneriella sp.]|nr:Beta-barrel assembly-enhancing protease [Turneriella sp.]
MQQTTPNSKNGEHKKPKKTISIGEYLTIGKDPQAQKHDSLLKKNQAPVKELSLLEVEELSRIKAEAKRAYRRKDFITALARFDDALQILPGDLEFSYYQALCFFQLHQWDKAEEFFAKIAELDELHLLPDVRKMQALTLLKRRKYIEAEELLTQAVRDRKNDTQLMNMLAFALERQNKLVEAERILLNLVDKDPENINGMNSLAMVYCRLEKNYSEALQLVKKALIKEPRNAHYLDTLGMLYAHRGNRSAAKKTLQKALEFAPGHPEIVAHLSRI